MSEVPDLNHVFQTAEVGGMAEYPRLDESFSPAALDLIADWILERFGPDGRSRGGGAGGVTPRPRALPQTAVSTGSGRTTTVSATSSISSAGIPTREACSRMASAPVAW